MKTKNHLNKARYYMQTVSAKPKNKTAYCCGMYYAILNTQNCEIRTEELNEFYKTLIDNVNSNKFNFTLIEPVFKIIRDPKKIDPHYEKNRSYVSVPLIELFPEKEYIIKPIGKTTQQIVREILNYHNNEVKIRNTLTNLVNTQNIFIHS